MGQPPKVGHLAKVNSGQPLARQPTLWVPWEPTPMGPMGTPPWGGEMQPRGGPWPPGREINGYPFTTFTDFSDFLGIIPRVSSDDLACYVDFHWSIESTNFYRLHGADCSPRFCRKPALRRNRFIERVELFEESPILPLSRCLEACQ